MLRTAIANFEVERIRRAKHRPVYLSGTDLGPEEILMLIVTEGWAKVFRSKSMNEKSSDYDSHTGMEISGKRSTCRFLASPVAMVEKEMERRYADWRPNLYHQIKWVSSLVAVRNNLPLLPAM